MAGQDGFLTPADVARRSGFSEKTVYRAIRSGALVASRPTAHYRITEADYQRWVAARLLRQDASPPADLPSPAATAERGSLDELRAIEREAA